MKFKSRFRIRKSDIKTKKDRCGMVVLGTLIINAVILPIPLYIYVCSSLRKVCCIYDDCNIEDILWDREKYWQSQLFTNVKGMNSISDLYSMKRKGCRKQ